MHATVTMHYTDAPLMGVLEDFARQAGGNLGIDDPSVAKFAEGRIATINLDNADFWQAMRRSRTPAGCPRGSVNPESPWLRPRTAASCRSIFPINTFDPAAACSSRTPDPGNANHYLRDRSNHGRPAADAQRDPRAEAARNRRAQLRLAQGLRRRQRPFTHAGRAQSPVLPRSHDAAWRAATVVVASDRSPRSPRHGKQNCPPPRRDQYFRTNPQSSS